MKKIAVLLIGFILFTSCDPKVSTQLSAFYPPLNYQTEVFVLGLDRNSPHDAQILGEIKIDETGFVTNCEYDYIIDIAKLEARKVGGNAIKITKHLTPKQGISTCHRIVAQILRINQDEYILTTAKEKEIVEEILVDVDYAILNIYRSTRNEDTVSYNLHLGDSVIGEITPNFKTTLHIKKDGPTILWAQTGKKSEVPININFGRTYYLRCGTITSYSALNPRLELMNYKLGRIEFESFKTNNP